VRTCTKCGATKPLEDFYRHKESRAAKCIECTKAYARQNRLDNIERVRAYDRERADLPHRRALRQSVVDRYESQFPERKRANTAVGNALRDGKLTKGPCAFCGSTERVHGHHHDYSKPLDVTWLCVPCHRRFHALEAMATYDRAGHGGSF